MFVRKYLKQNDEPGAGGGGAGAELPEATGLGSESGMEAAVDDIGASLGLGLEGEQNDTLEGGEPAAAPPPPAATPAPTAAPVAGTPPPAGTVDTTKAPDSWKPEAQAKWATLDPALQAEVHRREQDMFKGIGQYKQAATFANEIAGIVSPVMNELTQHRITPSQFLGNLTNVHLTLANPQVPLADKQAFAVNMLKSYGIEITPQAEGEPAYVDPQVSGLQQEIRELKSRLDGTDASRANEVRTQLSNDVSKFASDPANPYFNEVADDIALLIRGSGGQMQLKEAYDKAVFANPVTRAKEIARLQTESQAKAAAEQEARVKAARKATSANVRSHGHQGNGAVAAGSMDDTMVATLASINARK